MVSAAYAVLAGEGELSTAALRTEIERTHPLSRTMAERIDRLRAWAEGRAGRAH